MIRQGGNLTHWHTVRAFVSDSDLEVTHGSGKKKKKTLLEANVCVGGMQDSSALTEFYPKTQSGPVLP